MDKLERDHLRRRIILLRPHTRVTAEHPYLQRSCLLYLLRLAPLTLRNAAGVVERTAAGNYFGLPRQNFGEFESKFVAKFGYAQETAKTALLKAVAHCLTTGFPVTTELDPVFTLAICGLPDDPDVLKKLEHGLRKCLDRESVRLGQYTETFEHVYTDEQGDKLFEIFQKYTDCLEAGRKKALDTVAQEDTRRKQDVETRCNLERKNLRREYTRYVQQCRRVETQQHTRLQRDGVEGDEMKTQMANLHAQHARLQTYMRDQQRAAIKKVASDTPRVDVGKILADALIAASQMLE